MHKSAKLSANAAAKIVGCFAPKMGEHKNVLTTRRLPVVRLLFCILLFVGCCVAMDGLGIKRIKIMRKQNVYMHALKVGQTGYPISESLG